MLIQTCIVTGILLGLSAFGLTQEKPDFSGEWILNRQASTVSVLAKAVQSGVVQIEHRDPTFRYKAAFMSESGPLQSAFGRTNTSYGRTGMKSDSFSKD